MKKLFALALAVSAVGCGPQIELSDRPRFNDGVNTITFMLYNALTGQAITDATAAVTVTIGTYELTATHQGDNVLVLAQVPYGTHRALITAPGYLSFLGRPQGSCSYNYSSGPSGQCYQTYQVAMFPTDSVQSAVTVRAFEETNGIALKSGTAVATLTSVSSLVPVSGWTVLPGSFAERPNTLVVDLVNGAAVFPAADLVLGSNYSVDIYNAVSASDQLLTPVENETFQAGRGFPELTLFLGAPTEYPVALATSSEELSHVGSQASFWVKFPYQVEVCSEVDDHYIAFNGGYYDADADGAFATALPNPFAIARSGAESPGTVLTISPNWEVPPDTGDGHLDVYFYGIRVRAQGSNSCYYLEDVLIRNDNYVNPRMHAVSAP
ncbi:MAG: hypothetical protein M3Y59_25540 [Myxococcota bacterium]|nr:hypothetical protein [Myxococcota bacterium]